MGRSSVLFLEVLVDARSLQNEQAHFDDTTMEMPPPPTAWQDSHQQILDRLALACELIFVKKWMNLRQASGLDFWMGLWSGSLRIPLSDPLEFRT